MNAAGKKNAALAQPFLLSKAAKDKAVVGARGFDHPPSDCESDDGFCEDDGFY